MAGTAAIVGAVAAVAGTAASLAKGSPSLPEVPVAPPAPPKAPPPPALPPPPAPDTTGDQAALVKQKARRALGQERTILTSPLGVGGGSNSTLLGG